MSGLDATFLYLETPSLHMHVTYTTVFDPSTVPGGYSFDHMKAQIGERILQAPIFHRRIFEVPMRLGHPVWVEDQDFDLDYHVRRTAIPQPGGLRELAELAGAITSHPLDRSRPLWEMWFAEGLEHGNIGIITKMHHCTIDGVSGADLLAVLFDLERDPPPRPAPQVDPEEERRLHDDHLPSSLELVTQAVMWRAFRPFEIATQLVGTSKRVLDVRKVRQLAESRPSVGKAALPLSAPKTPFNGAITRRRNAAFSAIALDDVKRVKKDMGTTVNDVVLAVCTGALRSFLLERYKEVPDKPLVAAVPVSVRSDVELPGSNKVSTMFVKLPANIDDPVERLRFIHECTKGAKEEHHALGADTLLNWAEHATPNVFAAAARVYTSMRLADRHRPIANLVISNVPGPDFPLYLAGAELQAGFPLGPVMDGMGVNITVMTYRGVMFWGLLGCPDTIKGLWHLAAGVPRALEDLMVAAGLGRPTYVNEDTVAAARAMGVTLD